MGTRKEAESNLCSGVLKTVCGLICKTVTGAYLCINSHCTIEFSRLVPLTAFTVCILHCHKTYKINLKSSFFSNRNLQPECCLYYEQEIQLFACTSRSPCSLHCSNPLLLCNNGSAGSTRSLYRLPCSNMSRQDWENDTLKSSPFTFILIGC